MNAEQQRLASMSRLSEPVKDGAWHRWGPYLSERAWGTVREDYSANGDAWSYLPHDHARSRAYRWNEDGMAGISDGRGLLCFAVSLWNGVDPILKSRMFGLTGPQGNHGEDVKEYWWYVDATPSHAWLRWRYHYPQRAFPYADLVEVNARRGKDELEYELLDTGVFDEDRYWVVEVDHAKADPTDIRTRIRLTNRGPDPATLHVLPTLWFRNIWSWGRHRDDPKPRLAIVDGAVETDHVALGRYRLEAGPAPSGGRPRWLVCDNESNAARLWGAAESPPFPKDGIDDHVIAGATTVNPAGEGTKAAAWYRIEVGPGGTAELRLRLSELEGIDGATIDHAHDDDPLERGHARVMRDRAAEADEFYAELTPPDATADEAVVLRQAFAGMIWGKQLYRYDVANWLDGDLLGPRPPQSRHSGRNSEWRHLDAADVISMPDPWEYPWFAAWDLAFHAVTFANLDPTFAKDQLLLMCREWYMRPNGQLAAYEWNFGDVNPPVHAWAALRVFEIDGRRDFDFLERVFQKLLLNFTWWVNRKDEAGNNLFEGGFLGLDNIGPFDRSTLPIGGRLEQADGTGWMAAYSLWMLDIALELARHDAVYEDLATKFFEHFAYISTALNRLHLWDEEQGFFFDRLELPDGRSFEVRVRSIAGLVPLIACALFEPHQLEGASTFAKRAQWFLENRPEHAGWYGMLARVEGEPRMLVGVVGLDRIQRILQRVLHPDAFLSPYGIRSLSRRHADEPFSLTVDGTTFSIGYEPAESRTGLFGGNSNWRGPIWFPLNVLVIAAMLRYAFALGDGFLVEYPAGTGRARPFVEVCEDLAGRLVALFLPDESGARPADGGVARYRDDPAWRDLVTFYEYFDGDTGRGLGAGHQTGWTGLVAHLIVERGKLRAQVAAAREASLSASTT
jgi:hypothetical protein